jgi:hypothetical protein
VPTASESLDLVDLKFLPAWVREDKGRGRYADFEGEDESSLERPAGRPDRNRKHRPRRERRGEGNAHRRRDQREERQNRSRDNRARPPQEAPAPMPDLAIRFLPGSAALANVIAQIKVGTAAYSVYALARLFLHKPERYEVRVASNGEHSFFRLGTSGMISLDRAALENSAFRVLKDAYYQSEVTLQEPVKGNFTSVARERTSGVLLGPTNHHAYQPQLRRLYEQRFSRRMSFAEFQRQIEVVNDPALVEQWREDARKVTTLTTLKQDPPLTFNSEADAERHFREHYLPSLINETRETVIDGPSSRSLRDPRVARLIENLWANEVRSPSHMMQELAGRLRGGGLHIFRHRRGMLFVSPIRPKSIDETAVSESIHRLLETVKTSPRINRKDLAEPLIALAAGSEEVEKMKLSLASELRWLIGEGYIIEFNDGTLDLPRGKPPVETKSLKAAVSGGIGQDGSTESRPTVSETQLSAAPVIPSEVEEFRGNVLKKTQGDSSTTLHSAQDDRNAESTDFARVIPSRAKGEEPRENTPDAREVLRSAQDDGVGSE